ncbi:MAG TPA: type VI secretion system accessory protein TagJ [Bryobacteraceae bacterium]|nr:type VI secretion system accessory protein TagJ [Bryobacteraceae bacterium]
MTPKQLFQAGKLDEAITALGAELRDNPQDAARRTFLFELLCFAGEHDRAEKHLNVLAEQGPQAKLGAVLYFSALHAERLRADMFRNKSFPLDTSVDADKIQGTLNGAEFKTLEDGDPNVGTRLEVYAAGAYLWIPLQHIVSIEMEAPKRLRDLLWIPALVKTGPAFKGTELGEVLVPALCPLSFEDADPNIKLGRATEWRQKDGHAVPIGQKCFLVDDEEVPVLEVRKIEFAQAEEALAAEHAGSE